MIYQAFRGFNTWCWVVALLSLARSHLNFSNSLLQYANKSAYPFYLLHQSVIVAIGFYVVQWHMEIPEKFVIINAGALGSIIGLYELLIKRFNPIRFCFGLKPLSLLSTIAQPTQK
jgi:glucans biosynthesis protein C